MKFTKNNLKKTEEVFKNLGYVVRYEKGSFKSGYCLVENRQIAVINKFFDAEARMGTLLEILKTIQYEKSDLPEQCQTFLDKLKPFLAQQASETDSDVDGNETTPETEVDTTIPTTDIVEEALVEDIPLTKIQLSNENDDIFDSESKIPAELETENGPNIEVAVENTVGI